MFMKIKQCDIYVLELKCKYLWFKDVNVICDCTVKCCVWLLAKKTKLALSSP